MIQATFVLVPHSSVHSLQFDPQRVLLPKGIYLLIPNPVPASFLVKLHVEVETHFSQDQAHFSVSKISTNAVSRAQGERSSRRSIVIHEF
jgi:hypothetical protein